MDDGKIIELIFARARQAPGNWMQNTETCAAVSCIIS